VRGIVKRVGVRRELLLSALLIRLQDAASTSRARPIRLARRTRRRGARRGSVRRGLVGRGAARASRSIIRVDHGLNNATSGVYEPRMKFKYM
jgi:hypothetical protein